MTLTEYRDYLTNYIKENPEHAELEVYEWDEFNDGMFLPCPQVVYFNEATSRLNFSYELSDNSDRLKVIVL